GYQGATSLADKLTVVRAGYLDNINNAQLLNISAARLGYVDRLTLLAAGGAGELTVARVGYLDNINQAGLLQVTVARAGYLDNLSAGAVALAGTALSTAQWTNALATALGSYTAVRAGYLDNINNANLSTVPNISTLSAARIGYLDNINQVGLLQVTALRAGYLDNLSGGAAALEATLTAIKGAGWATETLVEIKAAIDALGGVNQYLEQIPDTDFALAAIDTTLTANPPAADAENSVVDIDQVGGSTFVLRSLWVNVTSFGTGAKLIFKLWTMLNAVVTMVDSVDVAALGIQNLVDIFGLQEVHADGIWITVQTDVGTTGACSGTYRYAIAS
ncbi:MAG: hypothetical protein Q7J06_11955, partial [Bacteroidales bacterium]|nr:hypothetical protein [Bacteroidales bacterium]